MRVIICTSLLDCPGFTPGFFYVLGLHARTGPAKAALSMLLRSNSIRLNRYRN